jgi:hypothetical protein
MSAVRLGGSILRSRFREEGARSCCSRMAYVTKCSFLINFLNAYFLRCIREKKAQAILCAASEGVIGIFGVDCKTYRTVSLCDFSEFGAPITFSKSLYDFF